MPVAVTAIHHRPSPPVTVGPELFACLCYPLEPGVKIQSVVDPKS